MTTFIDCLSGVFLFVLVVVFLWAIWLHHRFVQQLKIHYPALWVAMGNPTIMGESFISFAYKVFSGLWRAQAQTITLSAEERAFCNRYRLSIILTYAAEIALIVAALVIIATRRIHFLP